MPTKPKWPSLPEPLRKRTQKMAFLALLREEGRPAADQLIYSPQVILRLLRVPGASLVQAVGDLQTLLKRGILIEDEVNKEFVRFDRPVNQRHCAARFLYDESLGNPDNDNVDIDEALAAVSPYIAPNTNNQEILGVFKRFLELARLDSHRDGLLRLLNKIFAEKDALSEGIRFVNSLEGSLGEAAYPLIAVWRRGMQRTSPQEDMIDPRDQNKLKQLAADLDAMEWVRLWEEVLELPGKEPQWAQQPRVIEQFFDSLGTAARWEMLYWQIYKLRPDLRGEHQYRGFPNYLSDKRDRSTIERIIGCYPEIATGKLSDRRPFLEKCGIARPFTDDDLSGTKQKFTDALFRLADDLVILPPVAQEESGMKERSILGRLLLFLRENPCDDQTINRSIQHLIEKYHFGL